MCDSDATRKAAHDHQATTAGHSDHVHENGHEDEWENLRRKLPRHPLKGRLIVHQKGRGRIIDVARDLALVAWLGRPGDETHPLSALYIVVRPGVESDRSIGALRAFIAAHEWHWNTEGRRIEKSPLSGCDTYPAGFLFR